MRFMIPARKLAGRDGGHDADAGRLHAFGCAAAGYRRPVTRRYDPCLDDQVIGSGG